MQATLFRNSNTPTSFRAAADLLETGIRVVRVIRNNFQYTSEAPNFECVYGEEALTKMSMSVSEKSLTEDWEHESDEYWASYLK